MDHGTRNVRFMKKTRGQKSRETIPLTQTIFLHFPDSFETVFEPKRFLWDCLWTQAVLVRLSLTPHDPFSVTVPVSKDSCELSLQPNDSCKPVPEPKWFLEHCHWISNGFCETVSALQWYLWDYPWIQVILIWLSVNPNDSCETVPVSKLTDEWTPETPWDIHAWALGPG